MTRERVITSNIANNVAEISTAKTPYGTVIFIDRRQFGVDGTIVTGYYKHEELGKGLRRHREGQMLEYTSQVNMTVETVPREEQLEITEILKTHSYKEPIRFWD